MPSKVESPDQSSTLNFLEDFLPHPRFIARPIPVMKTLPILAAAVFACLLSLTASAKDKPIVKPELVTITVSEKAFEQPTKAEASRLDNDYPEIFEPRYLTAEVTSANSGEVKINFDWLGKSWDGKKQHWFTGDHSGYGMVGNDRKATARSCTLVLTKPLEWSQIPSPSQGDNVLVGWVISVRASKSGKLLGVKGSSPAMEQRWLKSDIKNP
jgi:hypothetical protein